ncbi:MAG: DUF4252 domain-containing protein [Alistipes sp.]|nr:DUF4252 domain-containing protein [Alistipes sp.]
MKRIFIILAVIFATLFALDAQAQTKEFKEYMNRCSITAMNSRNSQTKFEITQLSGAVLQQLMPKAVADKKGVVNRINSIFQVVMSHHDSSSHYDFVDRMAQKSDKYNHHMTMTLNGTEYKIYVASVGKVFEYLFLINNGKDYCICDIVGVLSTAEIMSFIGVKNNGENIKGDKTDTVEVIKP